MKRYKIREFSKLMGVTIDLVKHYQDTGIVEPEINKENKYRYYTIRHGERIVASRRFRGMGFGLQDTRALLHEKNQEEVMKTLSQKYSDNEKQIRKLQLQNECLVKMRSQYKELLEKAGTFEVKEVEGYYYIPHVYGVEFIDHEAIVSRIPSWMDNLEFAYKTFYVKDLEDEEVAENRAIGFFMDEKFFKELNMLTSDEIMYVPSGKRLIYYYRGLYGEQIRFGTEGQRILEQAKQLGYPVDEEYFMMQHIFDDHEDGKRYGNYLVHIFLTEEEK